MKTRRRQLAVLLASMIVIGTLYTNCESPGSRRNQLDSGTGVGNPVVASEKLVASACDVISRCHPELSAAECREGVLATSGLDYQIGLPTGRYSTFKAVIESEEQGALNVDDSAAESCAQLVANLSCESPQVAGAFDSSSRNFWGAPRLFLENACAGVLGSRQSISSATFHYIRAGATGRGDGLDWENACPDFTGACAGDRLIRGHTYYVAAGDYSAVDFDVPGTEVTTVKRATASDHGTATGWSDAYASGAASFPYWVFHSSHWVIDGQSRTSREAGHGFRIDVPRLNPSCSTSFCNAILLDWGSTIDRLTLRYVEVVGFGPTSARHLNGLYSVPIEGTSTNVVLIGVSMHDFGMFNGNSPIKTSGGVCNLTIDDSAFIRSAARVLSDVGSQNVVVRNSWFENVSDQGVIVNAGNGLFARNWTIHGNVFWESDPTRYGIDDGVIQCTNGSHCIGWTISNNTFANFTSDHTGRANVNFRDGGTQSAGNRILNNIWYNSHLAWPESPTRVSPSLVPLLSDYNLYASMSNADSADDEDHGVVSAVDPFVNIAFGDFRLAAPTAPGLALPSPLDLARDGIQRGADGVWDRGAFEYR